MIETGKYTGYYSYKNPKINQYRGYEKTLFEIEILTLSKDSFTGKVHDELSTGGTEGIGEIKGKMKGDKIYFVKLMPVMTMFLENKNKKTYDKKHPPIYYSGQFSKDDKTIVGTWRFKLGIVRVGFSLQLLFPIKGVWTMTKKI